MIADTIGHYRITGKLGEGGMGEVYRAKDTKLDREVAIKILPESVSQDPERLARFTREAKVLASLNHPNIAQIYGIEDRAIVMELVEGETLRGPLPLETALNYAKQIAEALEVAHEKGITHRDLKPANIMITPAGVVKILDFGLASVPSREVGSDPTNSPTITMVSAQTGMITGTAAYMSPEQARGQSVDRRADIWAFGVVLWEMLTGRQLFQGATVSDIIAAVLRAEPNFEQVPAKVRPLMKRCLEKEPKKRLQAIGDLDLLLQDSTSAASEGAKRARPLPWIIAAAALAVALAGVSWMAYRATRTAGLKPLVRFNVDLGGQDVPLGLVRGASAVLSPDGARLVYASQGKLFTRKLDQPEATELVGTEGAYAPFFSPDGQWVAFFAVGKLKKLFVEGGAPAVLSDASLGVGGDWGEDGTIIAALSDDGALSRISSTGVAATPVTELAPGESTHRWPQILPGGKAVLFTSNTSVNGFDAASIEVVSLKDHRRKTLQRTGTFGRYLPSGHLVYVNNGTLFAVAFDVSALEVRGTPVPVLEHVYSSYYGLAHLNFSQTGMLLYRSGGASGSSLVTVQWLDSAGKTQPLLAKPGNYSDLRLSPDGQRLALDIPEGSKRDVWIYEWQRDTMKPLTFDAGGRSSMDPVWSPDGRYIIFGGKGGIFWTRSDGASKPQQLTQSNNSQYPWSFTPDGKRLAWMETATGGLRLWTMTLETHAAGLRGGKPESFPQNFDERQPVFSPDGRWLAYVSNASGIHEVYVRAFPDTGGQWQISNGGGAFPIWSRNGHELFFRSSDSRIMVVTYTVNGDSIMPDKPRAWSKRLASFDVGFQSYDLAPDGKRFAVLMPVETPEEQQAQNHVVLLLNFFDELRRKVPLSGK